jgi:hypothetical protein
MSRRFTRSPGEGSRDIQDHQEKEQEISKITEEGTGDIQYKIT